VWTYLLQSLCCFFGAVLHEVSIVIVLVDTISILILVVADYRIVRVVDARHVIIIDVDSLVRRLRCGQRFQQTPHRYLHCMIETAYVVNTLERIRQVVEFVCLSVIV
jgi:hypothetical protein